MNEYTSGPIGPVSPTGQTGPTGPKGMPGPRFAATELEMIMNIIIDLEKADYYGERGKFVDGENPTTAVDSFALSAAIRVLKNYEALLSQPIYKLVPPGFFDIDRPAKTLKSVR